MIQVSIGRRSRSPFSPLSLRMMSRADLIEVLEQLRLQLGSDLFSGQYQQRRCPREGQ